MTSGVEMFITSERLILLDTQPVMSLSVLEELVQNDRERRHGTGGGKSFFTCKILFYFLTFFCEKTFMSRNLGLAEIKILGFFFNFPKMSIFV